MHQIVDSGFTASLCYECPVLASVLRGGVVEYTLGNTQSVTVA